MFMSVRQRGLQVKLSPRDLLHEARAEYADLIALWYLGFGVLFGQSFGHIHRFLSGLYAWLVDDGVHILLYEAVARASVKADGAICSRLDGKDTYCKLEQSQNAERSISLTPSGISMRFRFLHWLNVPEDIFFMPFSIKTPFKELHRLKADDPISFTEPGINTWYIPSQPAKALSPIFVYYQESLRM